MSSDSIAYSDSFNPSTTIYTAPLVILDDFGIQPVKMALLQILEDHYEKYSIINCSQLPVGKWREYLAEPTIADAILDRIIPKSHRIELKGKSLRTGLN